MSFEELVASFFEERFRLDPLRASLVGVHDHDGSWPDWSDRGRRRRLAWAETWADRLLAVPAELTVDDAIDRDRLLLELSAMRYDEGEAQDDAWDARVWVDAIGLGLFVLLSREFAPLEARLAAVAGRLEALGAVVDAAIERLVGVGAIPVSRLHVEAALEDLEGIGPLIDLALELAQGTAGTGAAPAQVGRLAAAAEVGRRELDRLGRHLRDVALPRSEGEGRLGADRLRAKFARTFHDGTLTPERVLEAAESQFVAVRAEMARLARDLWPSWFPGRPMPGDEQALVRAVLDAIAEDHGTADEMIAVCRSELARVEAFCRETGLVRLVEEPLAIEWTPSFLRSVGIAMLLAPGPLDRGLTTYFFITAPDPSWSPERIESYLREENRRALAIMTIHEGVPGHHHQAVRRNEARSLVRSAIEDGVYAEGWAVYVEQVLFDHGFAADDATLRLTHWKVYLRCVVNAIIDIRIHALGMTEDEALALMMEGAFQEESEARSKWQRARLTSAQLSTYFVGSLGMWEAEWEVRRRRAATAGGGGVGTGAGSGHPEIPQSTIVHAPPETPGFSYPEHLEAVLAAGEVPLPILRRILAAE